MTKQKITILGCGNLGKSILKGLIKAKVSAKEELVVTENRKLRVEVLKKEGYHVIENNHEAIKNAEIIIISVKPQQMTDLLHEIKEDIVPGKHIIISTVTGYTLKAIEDITGKIPIFRIMPNIALEICESMTCVSFINASHSTEKKVMDILNQLGKTIVIGEELLGASTVLGACGIAFALRFMRAATQGGIEIGFSSELSQLITAQTIKGASELILSSGNHPEREIDKVTTPQGITISGLNEMEHQGFSSALIKGLITSYNKLINLEKNN